MQNTTICKEEREEKEVLEEKRERRRRCLRKMIKRRRRPLHRIVFRDLLGPNISLVSSPLIIYEMGVESQTIKF